MMNDLISRQAAIDAIVKCTNCNTPKDLREYVAEHSLWSLWSGGVLEALEAVEGLPSALPCPEGFDPEHLTEQDKKDILEALDWVKGTITEEVPSAQHDLQPTCNQLAKDANVPCKDTIYRKEAIDMIMGQPPEAHYPSWYAEQIKALPSAPLYTPDEIQTMQDLEWSQMEKMYELGKEERKKGKWIPHEGGKFVGFPYMHYECSECRAFEPTETNFCPNCGSQNIKEGDAE